MIRYTTPTYELTVAGVDLTAATVFVTFEQFGTAVTVEGPETRLEGDDTIITCTMTQDQTAQFQPGEMRLQVNWLDGTGARCATVAKNVPVMEQLLEEVK